MNVTTRKPLSGKSLHLRSWAGVALPADELSNNMDFGEQINRILTISNIVLFCRRPRFSFDPKNFSIHGNRITGHLLCRVDGLAKTIPFSVEIPLKEGEASLILAYKPHWEIHIIDKNGNPVRILSAHGLSQHPEILIRETWINDLEVLYVGNVYKEELTSAFLRVKNDKDLQQMLAQMREKCPDDDIVVYAFEYLPYEIVPMFGILMPQGSETGEKRFLSTDDHPLNEFQKTCMTQAALIDYFSPVWNSAGKGVSRPELDGVLQGCETLDFSGLVIEISTVRSHFRLFSATVPPMHHHMNILDFSDPEKRAAFFGTGL